MSSERWTSRLALGLAFVAGPVLALIMQSLAYSEVPWACTTGKHVVMHVIPAVFVLIILVVIVASYSAWSRTGPDRHMDANTVRDRTRFLGLCGLTLSVASLALIVAMWVPLFVFDPCVR